jgi:hypothetical protein
MIRIDYKRLVHSKAMNKRPNQCALQLEMLNEVLWIQSINPRTETATTDLYIQVPKENIQNLINELEKLK